MCHREPMVEVVERDGQATSYGNVTAEAARGIARSHLRPSRLIRAALGSPATEATPPSNRFDGTAVPLPGQAEAHRARKLRRDRSAGPRRLPRPRRLPARWRACRQELSPGAGHRGHHRTPACAGAAARVSRPGASGRSDAAQPGAIKYVICNGDEGDPGAFMDRAVLESRPAPRARRPRHRRLRHRRGRGLLLHPRGISAGRAAHARGHRSQAADARLARRHCGSKSAKARARSSAARRPR